METSTNCENCGTAAMPGAAFCASCGASLKLQPPPEQNQTWWQGQQPSAAEQPAQPPVSQAQHAPAPIAAPTVQLVAPQAPQMGSATIAVGNVILSDVIAAAGFIGVVVVFFALPLLSLLGTDYSATEELGQVSDYANLSGSANLIYALWAVPALAGLGLALQALKLLNGQPVRQAWRSSAWCGALIIAALFISSLGYALTIDKVFGANAPWSSTEVFFWPITGIGNNASGYTMLTASAAIAVVSAWVGGSSQRGS